jgi:crossover junction endodeoxyribonuclease RuvC
VRILGIDPALAGPTGFGVVESDGRACRSLEFGVLKGRRSPKQKAHGASSERLGEIHAQITQLLETHAPDALAIEGIFSALNVKTALKLAEVRGVVLLAAAQRGVPVHSYSPREVKLSVSGYGHADKQQMQQMVRAQLRLQELPQPADASDALAVALCHIHSAQAQARFAQATAPAGPAPGNALTGSRARPARIQLQR